METIGGPRVVAAETQVERATRAIRELRPSLLLVDKGYGATLIADWVRVLNQSDAPPAVIVWGTTMSESESVRFLQSGVAGVILKTATLQELTDCIRTVASGGSWMEREVTHAMPTPIRTGRSALTAREMQVMDLVERGFKNKEIGDSLGIRTGTVKIHLKHIFEKTGIHGRYGLAISGLKDKGLLALAR
ncbi:MAG: response regulator transcription factor [Candidatus Solibacter sp.]